MRRLRLLAKTRSANLGEAPAREESRELKRVSASAPVGYEVARINAKRPTSR
jgi:hypothetical protein